MRDRPSALARVAGMATAVAVGLGLAGCGGAAAPTGVLGSVSPIPSSSVSAEPSAPATPPAGGANQPGGDTGPKPTISAGRQPDNEPPYIRDIYPDAYLTTDDETDEEIVAAIVQGHAYDPDGPHDQENTARVAIDWGDGMTADASLEGHGAFHAWHGYGLAYAGRTVTVRIIAHGHDGQTASQTFTLDLPEA